MLPLALHHHLGLGLLLAGVAGSGRELQGDLLTLPGLPLHLDLEGPGLGGAGGELAYPHATLHPDEPLRGPDADLDALGLLAAGVEHDRRD